MTDSVITCDKIITKMAVDGVNVNVLQELFGWFFLQYSGLASASPGRP